MTFSNRKRSRILLAFMLLATAVMVSPVAHAATFLVINNDGPGEGFNDPTAAVPVGGNPGTTIGQQRQIAFQFAANLWAARLRSNIVIRVGAQFNPLSCTAMSAILGQAGANSFFHDFAGAPVASTWYPQALANSLFNGDLDPGDDISAQFSSTIGTPGCLETSGWYYGLDGNSPVNRIDFVTVLLHELGHGLGFLTLVDLASGAKALGLNDTYMLNLENHGASPPDYPSMSNAQRVAASISTGNLHWTGAKVRALSGLLSAGTVGDHVRMFAPNPAQSGSSVSHWDTVLTPNQLMEPSYTVPLHNPILEMPLFRDISWTTLSTVHPHDFNADGTSDILLRHSSGGVGMWVMNNGTVASALGVGSIDINWGIVGQRDFNGDSLYDFLLRFTDGSIALWLMNGATIKAAVGLGSLDPATWSIVGTGDFNNDGIGDILWRGGGTAIAIWYMNSSGGLASAVGVGSLPSQWTVAGTGDFDGDGVWDILWTHTSGAIAVWLMNPGGSIKSAVALPTLPPMTWSIVGTGDFDGNGISDILLSASGSLGIWFMNSSGGIASAQGVGTLPAGWAVAQIGDFNGDAKADILLSHSSGAIAAWLMNGATIASAVGVGSLPAGWQIVNANVD